MSNLPYDPKIEEARAIAPLIRDYLADHNVHLGECSQCDAEIVIGEKTVKFASEQETEIICTDCAQKFVKGEL